MHGQTAVLWREPADIETRDLFWGQGGLEREPQPPFDFVSEDNSGSNPKFEVVDSSGVKWGVKMGREASSEIAASRLLWAVGYIVNDDYFLPEMQVRNMPKLHRGEDLVEPGGIVRNVRLKRHQKKLSTWRWDRNPFKDTRELNGLRVMMALINNWDLKPINNAVYEGKDDSGEPVLTYVVSDLGASFADTGRSWPMWSAKGNLEKYANSRFIESSTDQYVDFAFPTRPAGPYVFGPYDYFRRIGMRWIGQDIPTADARWIGELLGRLSSDQIRDAFRAAGYTATGVDGFTEVVLERIEQLKGL